MIAKNHVKNQAFRKQQQTERDDFIAKEGNLNSPAGDRPVYNISIPSPREKQPIPARKWGGIGSKFAEIFRGARAFAAEEGKVGTPSDFKKRLLAKRGNFNI